MQRVHLYRKGQGFTQEQMAETLDISTRAYINLERGINCCSANSLMSFLRCLPDDGVQSFMDDYEARMNRTDSEEPDNLDKGEVS